MKFSTCLVFLCLALPVLSQKLDNLPKTDQIQFLNLKSEFYVSGNHYFDKDTAFYGIRDYKICGYYYSILSEQLAYVQDTIIATYYVRQQICAVTYDDTRYYLKTGKDFSFQEFLQQNTADGKLKETGELSLEGRSVKLYREKHGNHLKYKLSERVR